MNKMPIVVYNKFLGVYSTGDSYDLPTAEGAVTLVTATNIDINKRFKIKARAGRAKKLTGDYANLWSNNSAIFATKGADLYTLTLDSSDLSMAEVLAQQNVGVGVMNYEGIGGLVYLTNNISIYAYEDGVIRSLRSTDVQFRKTMPPGYLLELHRGRMFIAKTIETFGDDGSGVSEYKRSQEILMQSEAGDYERYDTRDDKSWQSFPSKLTMIKSVGDGLFVSADKTYFLAGGRLGLDAGGLRDDSIRVTKVDDYPAIVGTPKKIRGAMIGGEYYDNAVLWETELGICVGSSGGKFKYLTEGRKDKSTANSGASYIKQGEINQYVVNTKG
jgi:hypothetical protein